MTIFGSDVSHYDDPDTRAMFKEGIVFQTHKAGGDANDAELAAWWRIVRPFRATVLLGAYWVLYPDRPEARADAFLDRLDTQCPGWRDGPFILQADCEKWNGDQDTVPSVQEVNTFCNRLAQKAPKLRPIGYLPDWVYEDISTFKYPVWSSKYVSATGQGFKSLYPGDSSSKWSAYGGKTPAILQYTSSATIGGQTTCDANAYKGTLDQLTALLSPGWVRKEEGEIIVPLTKAEITSIAQEVAYKLNADLGAPASGLAKRIAESEGRVAKNVGGQLSSVGAALLAAIKNSGDVDEAAVVKGVLATLTPEVIAGAIPAEIAQQVADNLAARLQA